MRSLIVEDDPISRAALVRLVEPLGPVSAAPDGPAGVRAATQALEAKQPFDLVLLDIQGRSKRDVSLPITPQ